MEYKRGGDPEWTPLTGKAHGSLSGHVAVHVARRLLDIDPEPGEVTEIPPREPGRPDPPAQHLAGGVGVAGTVADREQVTQTHQGIAHLGNPLIRTHRIEAQHPPPAP